MVGGPPTDAAMPKNTGSIAPGWPQRPTNGPTHAFWSKCLVIYITKPFYSLLQNGSTNWAEIFWGLSAGAPKIWCQKKISKIRILIRIFPEKSGFRKQLAGSGSKFLCVIYICQTPSTPPKNPDPAVRLPENRINWLHRTGKSIVYECYPVLCYQCKFLSLVWINTFKAFTVHGNCNLSML